MMILKFYYLNILFISLICFHIYSCDYLNTEKAITQGIYFFPEGLDPARNFDFYEFQIYSQIYETLLTIGEDYKSLKPGLAQSWSTSNDMTTFKLTLKPNILFHDGSRLDSEAVCHAFYYQTQRRIEHPLYKMIKTVHVIDSLNVQIDLKYPFAPFLYTLTSPQGFQAISIEAIKKYGEKIDKHPCGTGSF